MSIVNQMGEAREAHVSEQKLGTGREIKRRPLNHTIFLEKP